MNRQEILAEITKERNRQDIIHPFFPLNEFEKLALLTEEVGEVAMAMNDGNEEEKITELIQTASLIFRWLENEG